MLENIKIVNISSAEHSMKRIINVFLVQRNFFPPEGNKKVYNF